jgi:hypothetical protein
MNELHKIASEMHCSPGNETHPSASVSARLTCSAGNFSQIGNDAAAGASRPASVRPKEACFPFSATNSSPARSGVALYNHMGSSPGEMNWPLRFLHHPSLPKVCLPFSLSPPAPHIRIQSHNGPSHPRLRCVARWHSS